MGFPFGPTLANIFTVFPLKVPWALFAFLMILRDRCFEGGVFSRVGTFCGNTVCVLWKNLFFNCPPAFKTILFRIYVDDTFCIFENNCQAEGFLQYLNSQHPDISFTHER